MVFDAYARYYDLLYRDKDYGGESAYVVELIRRHARQARRILELGCGTGGHAIHLTQAGYTVHGVDQSGAMLERAKARRSTLPSGDQERLSFAVADARSLRTRGAYDVVVALFHVLSYQQTDADLDAMFATAAAHLQPGGLFIFDFWYGPAVLAQVPETRVRRLEDEEIQVTRIAEPSLRAAENLVDVNYSVFMQVKATGKIEQVRETHTMRYLFLPELALKRGRLFDEQATFAWMSNRAPTIDSWAGVQVLSRTSV